MSILFSLVLDHCFFRHIVCHFPPLIGHACWGLFERATLIRYMSKQKVVTDSYQIQ